tara:strand:+ start:1035 stop:1310 length:276 start_codon:yes stop_codon:yes gene_type:complete
MLEVLEAKRDSYRRQLEVLRTSHNDEILKRNALSDKYRETLEELQKEFENKKKELTNRQKNDIKEVVIKSKGNPDEIKRKIKKEFGFVFVE